MIPKRPFLLRAFYDWIAESNMTPHILVNTESEEVSVPRQHIKEGKIVLNVSPMAVQDFMMDNEALSFSARFGGVAFYIYCPMYAIEAIYAREAPTEGISFAPDEYADITPVVPAAEAVAAPVLSAVDNHAPDESATGATTAVRSDEAVAAEADGAAAGTESQDKRDSDAKPSRKRPALRVVK